MRTTTTSTTPWLMAINPAKSDIYSDTPQPDPRDDRSAAYRRDIIRRFNSRHNDTVRAWEQRVVARVGRSDDDTLDLARELDRLQREGHDAAKLLRKATVRRLPTDRPTAAVAYRVRRLSVPIKRQTTSTGTDHYRSAPSSSGPGIGM